jgi:lipopolysaccharide transport system ATP-binding protein
MSSSAMSGELAIRVEGLSKRYRLGARQPYRRIGDALLRPFRGGGSSRRKRNPFLWALRDVSFEVEQGEMLGVIGSNGAGKTTLLRVLSKITLPTKGKAEIWGRVGTLLEVGTGFHPELTGRENVSLNGAILGMSRREVAGKYEEIVAFSQLSDEFMETPVKHYSSGMRVRLAFSVAAHLEPEILFIDEVLAVGDAAFQQKCLGKMEEVANSGRTLFFVSHNMGMVTGLCSRAIWLDGGKMRMDGEPQQVVEAYLSEGLASDGRFIHPPDADCGRQMRLHSVEIVSADGSVGPNVPFEEPVRIRIEHEVFEPVTGVAVAVRLTDASGNVILVTQDVDTDPSRASWEPGRYRYTFEVPGSLLRPGRYFLSAQAKLRRGVKLDEHENCLSFEVMPIRFTIQARRPGVITPILPWTLESVTKQEATA